MRGPRSRRTSVAASRFWPGAVPQDGLSCISRASLTAMKATATTPATSTTQSAAVRHGKTTGTTSAPPPPSSRRARREPAPNRGERGVRSGFGNPRAGGEQVRRSAIGRDAQELLRETQLELDAVAADRLGGRDPPVTLLGAADGDRGALEARSGIVDLVEQLAVGDREPRTVER